MQGAATGGVGEWLARYLAPVLLFGVACSQIVLADLNELLVPARGGGFGLFSTVDKLADRRVRMFWIGPKGSVQVALPANPLIAKWIKSAASLPTEANLRVIADLADRHGRPVETQGEGPFSQVRVEVWKRAFDASTLRASRVEVAELVVERRK